MWMHFIVTFNAIFRVCFISCTTVCSIQFIRKVDKSNHFNVHHRNGQKAIRANNNHIDSTCFHVHYYLNLHSTRMMPL